MGWKERRSGGAPSNRSGGARSNRRPKDLLAGNRGDPHDHNGQITKESDIDRRPNDLLAGSRAGPHDHNDIYSKQFAKESDIGKRFKSLEEKGSSKYAEHFAVKDIDIDRQTCDRRPKDLLAGNRVDPHDHNEQITKESDIGRRFKILEEKCSSKCTGHSFVKDIETDAQTCHGSISSAATLEEHKTHFGDASERENMPNRGANHNTRPNDLLAGSRAGPHDHNDIYSKQIAKVSDIGKRFKSLEEKGSSKYAEHFAVKDIDIDRQTCDRRCRCVAAALDRRYFDQPFACIHCHGSAIQSLVDYIEWNPITEAFVPPGDAYGDVFVDAGINIRVILRSSTTSLHRVHNNNNNKTTTKPLVPNKLG